MAYYSGVANNLSDLLTALTTNLVTEGWANPATNIYSKSGIFVKLVAVSSRIEILCGTGNSGTDLTGTPPVDGNPSYTVFDGTMSFAPVSSVFTYPLNYHLHINDTPDEVYFFANDGDRWTWMCFGKSIVSGLTGSGNWYGATCPWKANYTDTYSYPDASETPSYSNSLFFGDHVGGGSFVNGLPTYNTSIHHGLDGNSWSKSGDKVGNEVNTNPSKAWVDTPSSLLTIAPIYKLMQAQPNTWNGEAILIRIQSYIRRGSGKFSLVSNLEHCRFIRNTNYNSGDTIILGSDTWHVYPMVRKNSATPTPGGTSPNQHSGTWGIAVRE